MAYDNSKIVYGGDMMLFISSGATKLPLAFSTSSKLSVSTKTRDLSNRDSSNWTEKASGRFDWNASSDGLLSFSVSGTNGMDVIYSLFTAGLPVNVAFASKSGTSPSFTVDSAKKNFTGTGIIVSIDMNSADADTATYSITIEGSGALVLA